MELLSCVYKMTSEITKITRGNPSVYLLGSAATGDFRYGWSDINILVLTEEPLSEEQAEDLLFLRRRLSTGNRKDKMRLFEGGILSKAGFLNESPDRVVYFGAYGERICARYTLNAMSMIDFLDNGILLSGRDIRAEILRPSEEKIRKDIETYDRIILKYGSSGSTSVNTVGKMLDISRCIYTLGTGKAIPRTTAGELAVRMDLCPEKDVMKRVLEIRYHPDVYLRDEAVREWICALPPHIGLYAEKLGRMLVR